MTAYHGAAGRVAADGLLQRAAVEEDLLVVVVGEHGVELPVGAEHREPGLRRRAVELQPASVGGTAVWLYPAGLILKFENPGGASERTFFCSRRFLTLAFSVRAPRLAVASILGYARWGAPRPARIRQR